VPSATPFLFNPQLSNYYKKTNSKTKVLYFLFRGKYSQKSQAIKTHHVFGIQLGVGVNMFVKNRQEPS
jgi:hypothetical protein